MLDVISNKVVYTFSKKNNLTQRRKGAKFFQLFLDRPLDCLAIPEITKVFFISFFVPLRLCVSFFKSVNRLTSGGGGGYPPRLRIAGASLHNIITPYLHQVTRTGIKLHLVGPVRFFASELAILVHLTLHKDLS